MPALISISPSSVPCWTPNSSRHRCGTAPIAPRSAKAAAASNLAIALERSDGSVSVFRTAVLPHEGANVAINHRYVERLLKFLLWQKGGYRVTIGGDPRIADYLRGVYAPGGRARLRPSVHGRARVRAADGDRERRVRRRAGGEGNGRAAGPAPGRLPHRLRPGRQRPQVRGRGRRPGGLQRRGAVEPQRAGRSAIPLRRHPRFAAARRRAPAARGCHRRQRGGRLRGQRGARGLALPLGAARPCSTAACGACSSICRRPGAAFRSTW